MLGTLPFFVTFMIPLIATLLAGRKINLPVWTLCSHSQLSACLFQLFWNTYLCEKKSRADRDETHRRTGLFSSCCVNVNLFFFFFIKCVGRWKEGGTRAAFSEKIFINQAALMISDILPKFRPNSIPLVHADELSNTTSSQTQASIN